jgi:hypothetical protein
MQQKVSSAYDELIQWHKVKRTEEESKDHRWNPIRITNDPVKKK